MEKPETLFLGGPLDNQTVQMQENPPVFLVKTLSGTQEYWSIPSGGHKRLYLYISEGRLPKRVKYTYTVLELDRIGVATQGAILQVVEQGGDERTVTTKTSIGGTGSRVVYAVTAEAFVVPTHKNENN